MRIIGGRWRGRKLEVLNREGLRPTPDRVRETLFNWLAPVIAGAAVLDCFAGAGALGLEAASRRAARVTLLENDRDAARQLRDNCNLLQAEKVAVQEVDALRFLQEIDERYDIVFIDPPYARPELRGQVLDLLLERDLLHPGARIYLEWPVQEACELPHPDLQWLRQKSAGQVAYAIAQWCATG